MNLAPDMTLLDQTKSDLKLSGSHFMWKLCFSDHGHDYNCNIDGKHSKEPIFIMNKRKAQKYT